MSLPQNEYDIVLKSVSFYGSTCAANALFNVHECVGNYTLPLHHSVLVRSDIGYHGDPWDYVRSTC